MKNALLLLLFYSQLVFLQAADIPVSIVDFSFSAISNNLHVGDVITWTNNGASTHTVTSTTIPMGAVAFNGTVAPSATFQYTVTVAGWYAYHCTIHTSMTGNFTVVGTATATTTPTLMLNALYPNPALDNVHIESPKTITSIDIYSETGAFIKKTIFSSSKIDLSVSELEKGAYLIRIINEDGLVETTRILKM